MSRTTSVRLDEATFQQLETLAIATDRPKSWHLERAISTYMKTELAFIEAVQESLQQADAGDVQDFEEFAAELQQRINARVAQQEA